MKPATSATSATKACGPHNSAGFRVATRLRQTATSAGMGSVLVAMSQCVASRLRQTISQKRKGFQPMSQMSQPMHFEAIEEASGQRGSSRGAHLRIERKAGRPGVLNLKDPMFLDQHLDGGIATTLLAKRRRTEAKDLARLNCAPWLTQQPFEQEIGVGYVLRRFG